MQQVPIVESASLNVWSLVILVAVGAALVYFVSKLQVSSLAKTALGVFLLVVLGGFGLVGVSHRSVGPQDGWTSYPPLSNMHSTSALGSKQQIPVSGEYLTTRATLSIAVLAVVAILFLSKLDGRKTGIAILGVLFFVGWIFVRLAVREAPPVAMSVQVLTGEDVDSASQLNRTEQELTDKLWAKLTQAKIQLSDTAEVSDEEKNTSSDDQAKSDSNPPAEDDRTSVIESRPKWIDAPPKRVGNVYRQVVSSEAWSTVDECHANLEELFRQAVRARLKTLVAPGGNQDIEVPTLSSLGIGLDYIMREICRDEFTETVETSVGEMKRVHVLMEFDPAVEKHLRSSWQRHARLSRLVNIGVLFGLVIGALALAYGLLQCDTWTHGYYTKRLLIGVPVAIIVVVLLLVS